MLPTYAKTGRWNHEMNERLTSFFAKDGGTYIDVGANIGLTTIPTAQNPNVNVIAFEPDPCQFSLSLSQRCPKLQVQQCCSAQAGGIPGKNHTIV